jgi:hypothetical protein
MRRGFLNNTKVKPKYDRTSAKTPPVLDESQSITQPPNSSDPTLDDKDARNWAQRLGLSLDEFYKLVEKEAARRRQPFVTIYRNFMFERFQGVTYTDSTILDLLQVEYGATPPALRGAYRISAVRGKGLGMFAARDIPAGAVIACENPVIVLPVITPVSSVSKEEMCHMLFDRLDPPERDLALSLSNCKPADVCGKEEGIIRTNGIGLELPVPDTPTAPDPTHCGIFLDMSRCNHRYGTMYQSFDPISSIDTAVIRMHITGGM